MNTKALVAECIGTFTLIYAGVMAIAHGGGDLTAVALAHGLAIAVMISATAAVSGGHLNPAVTIGLLTARKIDLVNAIGYVVAQCVGGLAAAAVVLATLGQGAVALGTPVPASGHAPWVVIVIEAVLTFFLVFVVYGTAVDKRAPKVGGLFIGLTIVLGILAAGPITGAAINPARHLGPALLGGEGPFLGQVWIYWVGPVAGGIVAAQVYRMFLEEK